MQDSAKVEQVEHESQDDLCPVVFVECKDSDSLKQATVEVQDDEEDSWTSLQVLSVIELGHCIPKLLCQLII